MTTTTLDCPAAVDVEVGGHVDLDVCAAFRAAGPEAAEEDTEPGVLRLAFPMEGTWQHVGAIVRRPVPGLVRVEPAEDTAPELVPVIVEHVRRMLSLDVDDSGLAAVERADPVVRSLRQAYPGLRPMLFHTPYEAACWAVLCQGVQSARGTVLKRRIAEAHGRPVRVAGRMLSSFPAPGELLGVLDELTGLSAAKVRRLGAVAGAASRGVLDAPALSILSAEDAVEQLREVPGIGPYSASLIVLRGVGHPDVFPRDEPWLHTRMAHAYDVRELADLERIAERWRPYRSWVTFLLRAAVECRLGESAA